MPTVFRRDLYVRGPARTAGTAKECRLQLHAPVYGMPGCDAGEPGPPCSDGLRCEHDDRPGSARRAVGLLRSRWLRGTAAGCGSPDDGCRRPRRARDPGRPCPRAAGAVRRGGRTARRARCARTGRSDVRVALERGRLRNSAGDPAAAVPLFRAAAEGAASAGLVFLQVDALHMLAIADPAHAPRVDGASARGARRHDRRAHAAVARLAAQQRRVGALRRRATTRRPSPSSSARRMPRPAGARPSRSPGPTRRSPRPAAIALAGRVASRRRG